MASYADQQKTLLRQQASTEADPTRKASLLADAQQWDEGGAYRVALHTATGGLAGGVAGAAGAGTVAAAAPLMNELQSRMTQQLIDAGVNPTVAKGTAQAVALTTAAGIGVVAGGGSLQGAAAGWNVDANNRQLHPDEKIRIKQLAGKDATKEARLTAAACSMMKCYAEYAIDSTSYVQLKQLADIGASDALAGERQLLTQQSGLFGYSTNGVFNDANIDAIKQLNNSYQIDTRAIGAAQTVAGGLGVASSAVTAPVTCVTGIGCVANAVVGTVSIDAMYAGAKQVVSGNPESTYVNKSLQGLGMSPEAAGLVEAALGVGSAVTAGAVANKAIDQSIALSKLSTASYQSFTTNGLKATEEVMQTPQAKALIKEIQIGNPKMTVLDAAKYAKDYLLSGTSIPIMGVAAPDTTLIKVVPKGDSVSSYTGYWMSTQQAQAIAKMTTEQAGQILGLPAAQAANILKNGMDSYMITPKAGASPTIFISDITGTKQGLVMMSGGAQQVIVPNRNLWTTPTSVNPLTFRSIGGK